MFVDMTADAESNKKLSLIVTELFLRVRKLNTLLLFISQSYFKVPETMRLNATHYFIMKIPNKRELEKSRRIICSTLILKILSSFIKIILKNHIHF